MKQKHYLDHTIKEERFKKNATQKEVADAIGCTTQAFSLIERGERMPSVIQSLAIARFFNKSVYEIFTIYKIIKNNQRINL